MNLVFVRADARSLLPLIRTGFSTPEQIRAGILVSEKDKIGLLKILDADTVGKLAEYRTQVALAFDEFIAAGVTVRQKSGKGLREVKLRQRQREEIARRKRMGHDTRSIARALKISQQLVSSRVRQIEGRDLVHEAYA